jgi:hypothetical protein
MAATPYAAREDLYLSWKSYVVLAPLALYLIFWALAILVFEIKHPFISTFATVELLPLAALILMGVSAEVENDAIFSGSAELSRLRFGLVLGVMLMFVSYGALKARALQLLEQSPLDGSAIDKLVSFGIFSIACTFVSVIAANHTKVRLLQKQVSGLI